MIKIVKIKDEVVYPIFKCGLSSIQNYAKEFKCRWYINEQIKRVETISIFFRTPQERFISGVHSFIEFEKRKNKNLDYETMVYGIANYRIQNEHFKPQYYFIKDLAKYFKKEIHIKPFKELLNLIPNRDRPHIPDINKEQRSLISKISYPSLQYDEYILLRFLGKKINIIDLIKETEKNALSTS